MSLINPKPRFAYDTAADAIYDYLEQRDVPLSANYIARDGEWNLLEVKRRILAGETVEGARLGDIRHDPAPLETPALTPETPAGSPSVPSSGGFTAAALTALKLTAIQAAVLGLKPDELNVNGVTGEQVRNWGINAARADALHLTPEQRAALCP